MALSGRTAANAGISRSDSYGYSTEFTRVMDVMVDAEADQDQDVITMDDGAYACGQMIITIIRISCHDHHPSVAIIRIFCHDHRPSVAIITIFCCDHHPS